MLYRNGKRCQTNIASKHKRQIVVVFFCVLQFLKIIVDMAPKKDAKGSGGAKDKAGKNAKGGGDAEKG